MLPLVYKRNHCFTALLSNLQKTFDLSLATILLQLSSYTHTQYEKTEESFVAHTPCNFQWEYEVRYNLLSTHCKLVT